MYPFESPHLYFYGSKGVQAIEVLLYAEIYVSQQFASFSRASSYCACIR